MISELLLDFRQPLASFGQIHFGGNNELRGPGQVLVEACKFAIECGEIMPGGAPFFLFRQIQQMNQQAGTLDVFQKL